MPEKGGKRPALQLGHATDRTSCFILPGIECCHAEGREAQVWVTCLHLLGYRSAVSLDTMRAIQEQWKVRCPELQLSCQCPVLSV
jgi:hypothetical protein